MLNRELAFLDPAAAFASPEEVRDHGELDTDEKIDVLKRWAYDNAEADVAAEEGMPGEAVDDELQHRIYSMIEALGGSAQFGSGGPTKQHGLPGARRRRGADE